MHRLLMTVLVTCYAALGSDADPVGQKAKYTLDKDPKRTSSMIKSGTVDVSVTKAMLDAQPPAYEVSVQYKVKVALMGDQEGTEARPVDAEYFTPAFIEKLRKDGSYTGPNFKAKHLGYADAKNLDGKQYPNCDKVLLYDIQQGHVMNEMMQTFFGSERADVEDLQVLAHVYAGVPVLGAVKIDANGKYQGMAVKAGGDYVSP